MLLLFDYFSKSLFQTFKPGRVNLTVVLDTDYCKPFKILHHSNEVSKTISMCPILCPTLCPKLAVSCFRAASAVWEVLCVCVCVCACMCACVHACVCVCVHVCVCA